MLVVVFHLPQSQILAQLTNVPEDLQYTKVIILYIFGCSKVNSFRIQAVFLISYIIFVMLIMSRCRQRKS